MCNEFSVLINTHCSYSAQFPPLLPLRVVHTVSLVLCLLPQCSGSFCHCSTVPHRAHACVSLRPGVGALTTAWGLPGGCQEQHCDRAVRQCPCPVPSWLSCSRAELWSCPKKEARDGEVLCLQLAFLYKLPLGRIFCPKPWARGFVPWEECLPFSCHWFMSCLSLYQPCLVAGQEQFAANFFKLAGKLLLQILVPCLFTYL